jgi:hypothetical protein
MSRKTLTGLIILLAGSLIVGVVAGLWYFGLFEKTVPPAVLTSFNKGTAKAAFITYGVLTGVLLFIWSLAVVWLGRFFKSPATNAAPSAGNVPSQG